jgi:hypothetical protein
MPLLLIQTRLFSAFKETPGCVRLQNVKTITFTSLDFQSSQKEEEETFVYRGNDYKVETKELSTWLL